MKMLSEKTTSRWLALVIWVAMVAIGLSEIRQRRWSADAWLVWAFLWLIVGVALWLTHRNVANYPSRDDDA